MLGKVAKKAVYFALPLNYNPEIIDVSTICNRSVANHRVSVD